MTPSPHYLQFTAKPSTWFKAGTEALWEDARYRCRRPTVEEYECQIRPAHAAVFVGTRITEDSAAEGGAPVGVERQDGEWCSLDEFEIKVVSEDREIAR